MFKLPVHVLVKHSPFFAKALQGSFKEGKTKVIELPEDEPMSFSCFANWTCKEASLSFVGISDSEMNHNMKMQDLAKVWIFAEKVRAAPFQNFVMDIILDRYKDYKGTNISLDTFNYIFDNTMDGSQLRHIFVDFANHKMSPSWYNLHKSELHVECIEDLCLAQMSKDRFSIGRTRGAEHKLHNFFYYVKEDEDEDEDEEAAMRVETERSKAPQKLEATPEQMKKRRILTPHSVKRLASQLPEL
jgi:hypothetical protein